MFVIFLCIVIAKLLYDAICVVWAEAYVKANNPYKKYRALVAESERTGEEV